MNDQIYEYLKKVLETIYDRKGESAFVQYLFNMDNPHYITMAIFLAVSAYEKKEINVADLKKKLTCSDRQVDIMIQTLIDKKFIFKDDEKKDKRIRYIKLMNASQDDLVKWAIHTSKAINKIDLTLKRSHQV